jgi:hypothetical protein
MKANEILDTEILFFIYDIYHDLNKEISNYICS